MTRLNRGTNDIICSNRNAQFVLGISQCMIRIPRKCQMHQHLCLPQSKTFFWKENQEDGSACATERQFGFTPLWTTPSDLKKWNIWFYLTSGKRRIAFGNLLQEKVALCFMNLMKSTFLMIRIALYTKKTLYCNISLAVDHKYTQIWHSTDSTCSTIA